MSKANADIKYDPELPFAHLDTTGSEVYARFKHRSDAEVFRERCNFGRVLDTTPKPKIPQDAEFVMWRPDENSALEFAECTQGYWAWGADEVSILELLDEIGDAEVTVLVRKDET